MVAVGAISASDVHAPELPLVLDARHAAIRSWWVGLSLPAVALAVPPWSLKETLESLKETFSLVTQPDPRYYKDPHGLRPRWRLLLMNPRWYLWLIQPRWLLNWRIERKVRQARRLDE